MYVMHRRICAVNINPRLHIDDVFQIASQYIIIHVPGTRVFIYCYGADTVCERGREKRELTSPEYITVFVRSASCMNAQDYKIFTHHSSRMYRLDPGVFGEAPAVLYTVIGSFRRRTART